MAIYVVLVRGINVGGKNKVGMSALKKCLEDLGYLEISTLLASGNLVLRSSKAASAVAAEIETALPKAFNLDSELIKVLALSAAKFKAMVKGKPKGFSEPAGKYNADAIFMMDATVAKAMKAFDPREGADEVWPGKGVIYHQRLTAKRTQTRLNKMMADPIYKSMTIRSWQTTLKLMDMLDA
ncbi:MAG: DUF1697 domain-containing protein [Devosia sp.]